MWLSALPIMHDGDDNDDNIVASHSPGNRGAYFFFETKEESQEDFSD